MDIKRINTQAYLEYPATEFIDGTVDLNLPQRAAFAQGAQWADEINTEENHIRYKIFRKNVDDFIDKDREDTIDFITEWLDNETDLPDVLIEDLANALRQANEEKNKICRRNRKEDEV